MAIVLEVANELLNPIGFKMVDSDDEVEQCLLICDIDSKENVPVFIVAPYATLTYGSGLWFCVNPADNRYVNQHGTYGDLRFVGPFKAISDLVVLLQRNA